MKKHGNTEESLAAIPAVRSVREILARLGDSDIEGTLSHVGSGSTQHEGEADPDDAAIYSVGMVTSGGQRFRILRPHARGGLGAVYVALDSELNREVALKRILDKHADDLASRQRFLIEAEVTGGLEHPGIVPVYGLGTYSDGRPYYAMRFVRGDNLKEAIDRFHANGASKKDLGRRSLELCQLLRRFLDVCNAIDYAHQPRCVAPGYQARQRDRRPARRDPRRGLGIGQGDGHVGPEHRRANADNQFGQRVGRDASRQCAGDAGLHEPRAGARRLAGPRPGQRHLQPRRHPLLSPDGPPRSMATRPTSCVPSSAATFRPPRSLDSSIAPALEAVCMKAMARRPEGRYASCRDLAGDIELWLADEPVSAYREPAPARLVRWGRRHRTLVAGLAATLLVAVVALSVGTVLIGRQRAEALVQRDRAEDNLTMARQIVDEMYTRAAARLTDVKGMDADQRDLLTKAARFYERFALPQSTDPAVRIEAGRAGLRAGEILTKLGETGPAEAAYARALRLLDAVAAADPADAESRRALADGHYGLADLYRDLGKMAEAKATLRLAAELHGRLAAADPQAAAPRRGIAAALIGLGNIENDLGRPADAEDAFKKSLGLLEILTHDYPGVTEYRSDQATAWNSLADLQRHLGRSAEAMASWERALAVVQGLVRDHPDITRYRAALARAAHNLGTVQSEIGRPTEARESYRLAAEIREALVRDHPDVPLYRKELAGTYNNLGNLLRDTDKPSEARQAFEQSITIKQRLADDHPDVAEYQGSLAISLANLGFLLDQIGLPSEALPPIQRAAGAPGAPGPRPPRRRRVPGLTGLEPGRARERPTPSREAG